ncbi:FAD-dependent oxidoreductase [Saccharibacter sp. 17.LH.SD]|uniref:NAD(P)/FAD-dependent oxidoreductase n=1 Tax=Saccharibacter sp. 17.LH.SD TaxID=2689393 RepID=UPI0013692738|nr:NAD(P)/FAD-dependent oxidoreductase [Saccharibacter sp. 17.LH.SD]MXV43975.1 FAD-dependent oxidoreductase [Saccharibacter sp. 17.LH.SD]
MPANKRVVILGGGIGGLEVATSLRHKRNVSVTLVDQNPVHIWKPALHEFAAGTIEHSGNLFSFIELSKRFGFDFIQSTPEAVERDKRQVRLANGQSIPYDYLIAALGARANDFGTRGAEEYCLFLNTLHDADTLHARFRDGLLNAKKTGKPLQFSIVGGGATGIQLAAELCQAVDSTPGLGVEARHSLLRPTLIEAMDRLIPAFPTSVSEEAKAELEKLGFDVITNDVVTQVDGDAIHLKSGRIIPSTLSIWAAGVKASQATSLFEGLELGRSGQLMVTPMLRATKDPSIFAIGDCARMEKDPVAPTAQAARQQGRYLGRIALPYLLTGRTPPSFSYQDRGAVVALGNYNAWGMWPSKKGFGGHGVGAYFARFIHEGLFRQHQYGLVGICKTLRVTLNEHFYHHADLVAPGTPSSR